MTTLAKRVTALHVRLYRAADGALVSRGPGGVPLLLLTTTGHRSGRQRTVPVGYVRHGHDLLISPGSASGPTPAWLHNLRSNPRAQVQLGRQHLDACAEEPAATEQEVLWRSMVAARSIYRLGERSGRGEARRIPVVIRLHVQLSDARATPPTLEGKPS